MKPAIPDAAEIFRDLPDIVLVAEIASGMVGKFITANPRALTRLGLTRATLIEQSLHSLAVEPRDIVDTWLEHLQGGGRCLFECSLRTSSLAIVPVEMSSVLLADGRTALFVGREMAARRELERAHYAQIELLHGTLDSLPSSVFLLDPEGYVIDGNRLGREQLAQVSAPRDMPLWDSGIWRSREARARVRAMVRAAGAGTPMRAADEVDLAGASKAVDLSFVPLHDDEGKIAHIVGCALDIIGSDIARDAAIGSESKQGQANARAAVGRVDHRGCWTSLSEQLVTVLGSTRESLLGEPCWRVLEHTDYGIVSGQIERLVAGEVAIFSSEHRLAGDADQHKWVRFSASMSPEEPDEILIHIDDVSDRKADELAAVRESRRLHQVRRDLIANVSHEIRTPMNAVIGMTEIALRTIEEQPARGYLEIGLASAHQLMRLLNDILDVSRFEDRTFEVKARPFDLHDVLKVALDALRRLAADKGLDLFVEMAADLPEQVTGDPDRLAQILTNLVANAIKFTAKGSVTVTASRSEDNDQFVLELSVMDSGIGIAAADLDRVFEPFEQVQAHGVRGEGGSGLGLAIVKELVGKMAGKIKLTSVPGQGSTFTVSIPLLVSTLAGDSGDSLEAVSPGESCSRARRRLELLAVDDIEANRILLEVLLSDRGHEVISVASGEQALAMLKIRGFDLALIDVQMPEMDGFALTRRIRSLEQDGRYPHLPIIAVTARAMRSDRDMCQAAGMQGFLSKPIDVRELVTVVEEFGDRIENAVTEDAAERPRAPLPKAIVETEEARRRLGGNDQLLNELIDLFLGEAPARIERIGHALADEGSFETAGREAHTLVGNAATIGASALRLQAARLEGAIRAGDAIGARAGFASLQVAMRATLEALRQHRRAESD